MRTYRRVSQEDRLEISVYLDHKLTKSEIAQRLGVHKSTITRELKRNSGHKNYKPRQAHRFYLERFKLCRRKSRMTPELQIIVDQLIKDHLSPEQIAHRLHLEKGILMSYEIIYRYLRQDKLRGGNLWKNLRRPPRKGQGRHRKQKYKPDWLLRIKERPKEINNRVRVGDWERDTMFAKDRKGLLVCVDRKTRYVKLRKFEKPRTYDIGRLTRALLDDEVVHSITQDNGSEFRDFELHTCPLYYCDPHKPQQRGTVENTIGLLRQFITNQTDMTTISDEDVIALETKLNLRPRKVLDYRTPYEVFRETEVALVS